MAVVQTELWRPSPSLMGYAQLIDRDRLLWGEGGQIVPDTPAPSEFNDPYNGVDLSLPCDTTGLSIHAGHTTRQEVEAASRRALAEISEAAGRTFKEAGFTRINKFCRFALPKGLAAIVFTDVPTERVARFTTEDITSRQREEDGGQQFVTVNHLLSFAARHPVPELRRTLPIFGNPNVVASKLFGYSLLRNEVSLEFSE
ncbi:hypothetical protein EYC59_00855 [Candidatus Saccharibacteria bacterium]|nr:MAG: hypothetical protein EYC59_00855 [Candidatus Saccharibacteria bacterium]